MPESARTREQLAPLELSAVRFAEAMAQKGVRSADARGNATCGRVCREAGAATYQAMATMGLAGSRPAKEPVAG